MKYLFLIPIFLILLVRCKISNNHSSSFNSISILTADKITKSDGKISIDSTWVFKIYNSNYVIYKLPKITMLDSRTKVRQDTIDLEFFNPDTTYRYFIVRGNDDIGLEYDNNIKNPKQFSLDSLLKDIGIHPSMFRVYNLELGTPSTIEHKGKHIRIEKFLNKKLVEEDPDSIYRYFDKRLIGINFSFSPSLDEKQNSKLFKTSFIDVYNGVDIKNNIVRAELYVQFKEIKASNPKLLNNIIERYEHDIKAIR